MKHFLPPAYANFLFDLTDSVELVASGERGIVVARTESVDADPRYRVRYRNAAGALTEKWWSESALVEPANRVVTFH